MSNYLSREADSLSRNFWEGEVRRAKSTSYAKQAEAHIEQRNAAEADWKIDPVETPPPPLKISREFVLSTDELAARAAKYAQEQLHVPLPLGDPEPWRSALASRQPERASRQSRSLPQPRICQAPCGCHEARTRGSYCAAHAALYYRGKP